jgi:hypothetical protein
MVWRCCYKREKREIFFASKRSSQLSGEVFSIKNYVVKWNNAYLQMPTSFTFDSNGKAITLKWMPYLI